MTKNIEFNLILEDLLSGKDLDESTSKHLMISWLNEDFSPVQTGALLAALRVKKASGIELASMGDELLKACDLPIDRPDLFLVDTCGTGGDGVNTFNISTAVAFVAAACGVKISKHGNRSASGKVGSADVLSNLGLNLNASLEKVILAVENVGITFLFAPAWHKSLVNLAPLRKSLGIRTIFNQLGPLVNPLRPNAQVLGVASEDLLLPMAEALNALGMKRAIIVYGYGGLDEASLEGDNKIVFVDNGNLKETTINIADYGYKNAKNMKLVVNNSSNEEIMESVLSGSGCEEHLHVVAFNTALVLWASGLEDNIKNGIEVAMNSMRDGKPWNKFLDLKNFLQD